MERVGTILEREGEVLETLLFKLIEIRLLIDGGEARFLPRATREVERARTRAREVDLLRAATVATSGSATTLRGMAADAPAPWAAILRDHHHVLTGVVAEIEVVAHQNACLARAGLEELSRVPVASGAHWASPVGARPIRNAELDHLARGAALDAVLGTAARLHMPDLLEFLR
jgi:hypothetical protein